MKTNFKWLALAAAALTLNLGAASCSSESKTPAWEWDDPEPEPDRAWTNNFDPKWYLSAFPSDEINKGYGLIQNPGW